MKTITRTTQNAINYGAVLQAYALQQQLLSLRIDDEILDFIKEQVLLKQSFNYKAYVLNCYAKLFFLSKMRREENFSSFRKNYLKTTKKYKTTQEILENPPIADAYITGGDQMFNTYHGVHPVDFLQFGESTAKRLSYSTSKGKVEVAGEYLQAFISALKNYDAVSVREECLKDYFKTLSIDSQVHIDPTFLVSKKQWEELCSNSEVCELTKKSKYILVYELLRNPLLRQAVEKIKRETGLKVIVITPNTRCSIKADKIVRSAGPLEFLELFKNAEYVMTTSFHGTCFSIIFQKQFYSFIRETGEIRINDLLKKFKMKDRVITNLDQLNKKKINFLEAEEIVKAEQIKAQNYIKEVLGI